MNRIAAVVHPKHYHILNGKAVLCHTLAVVFILIGTWRFMCEQAAITGRGERSSQLWLLGPAVLMLAVSSTGSLWILLIFGSS